MKYSPGAYWFGISLESDLAFADRLYGKTKKEYIEAIYKAWKVTPE